MKPGKNKFFLGNKVRSARGKAANALENRGARARHPSITVMAASAAEKIRPEKHAITKARRGIIYKGLLGPHLLKKIGRNPEKLRKEGAIALAAVMGNERVGRKIAGNVYNKNLKKIILSFSETVALKFLSVKERRHYTELVLSGITPKNKLLNPLKQAGMLHGMLKEYRELTSLVTRAVFREMGGKNQESRANAIQAIIDLKELPHYFSVPNKEGKKTNFKLSAPGGKLELKIIKKPGKPRHKRVYH